MKQSDMARSMAAGMDASMQSPEGALDGLPEEGMPEPAGPTPMEGIESALSQLESSLEGLDPDKATQIRTHLNAIRDVVGQATVEGEGMDSAAIAPPAGSEAPMGGKLEEVV